MYEQLLQDYADAWGSGDVDRVMAFFDADLEYKDIATGKNSNFTEMATMLTGFYQTNNNVRFDVLFSCIEDKCISWEWRMTGTKTIGESYDRLGMSVMEMNNNKIVRNRDYWSTLPQPAKSA